MVQLPPAPTLFPYTTLFRSQQEHAGHRAGGGRGGATRDRVRRQRGEGQAVAGEAERGGADQCLQGGHPPQRSEEHTSELQSRRDLVCRLLLEKKKRLRSRRW